MVYSSLATIWDVGAALTGMQRGIRKYINRLDIQVPDGGKILDVGCSTGTVSFPLARKFPGAEVVATDYIPGMVSKARQIAGKHNFVNISFGISDVLQPDIVQFASGHQQFAEKTFDLIVAGAVLEHVDYGAAIPKLLRLLKPGGHILVLLMKDNFFIRNVYVRLFQFHPIGIADLASCLKSHGCEDVRVKPFLPLEFTANHIRIGILARHKN